MRSSCRGDWASRTHHLAGKRVLVTGGCGYVGEQIALRLLALDPPVAHLRIHDISGPGPWPGTFALAGSDRVEYIRGDLAAGPPPCEGIDVVLHFASYGMSGHEMIANPSKIRAINVGGTVQLLESARACGARAVVYLSSQNVVFGGKPIYDADESLAYFPVDEHIDEYSRSKALAEMAVLRADDKAGLRTVAIRPASIYGEDERKHLPRIARNIAAGMCTVGFGDRRAQSEWVHIDNLADVVLSAAASLLAEPELSGEVGGQAFFVSDGTPINMLDFFAPIASALGLPACLVRVPVGPVLMFARACEFVCTLILPVVSLEPLLTRTEVLKVAIHHTFSNKKAARILGYVPRFGSEDGMRRVAAAFAASDLARDLRAARVRAMISAAMCCALVVALVLP